MPCVVELKVSVNIVEVKVLLSPVDVIVVKADGPVVSSSLRISDR